MLVDLSKQRWRVSSGSRLFQTHTQALDTTTRAGRAMFQMLGVFAEFEREMIRERVNSGLDRVRGEIDRKGRYETKNGHTIRRLGRPGAEPHKIEEARKLLAAGIGIRKVGRLLGLGTSTVQRLKHELPEAVKARKGSPSVGPRSSSRCCCSSV